LVLCPYLQLGPSVKEESVDGRKLIVENFRRRVGGEKVGVRSPAS
jgi:hypothetical protein